MGKRRDELERAIEIFHEGLVALHRIAAKMDAEEDDARLRRMQFYIVGAKKEDEDKKEG